MSHDAELNIDKDCLVNLFHHLFSRLSLLETRLDKLDRRFVISTDNHEMQVTNIEECEQPLDETLDLIRRLLIPEQHPSKH